MLIDDRPETVVTVINFISSTDIPHCGQLNIEISTVPSLITWPKSKKS